MPRQVAARVLLVLAVLLAQHTALAHELWHAGGAPSSQDWKGPVGKTFCDLHDLLGNVLGGVSVAKLPLALLSFSDVGFFPVTDRTAGTRPLAPQSRGPPALS